LFYEAIVTSKIIDVQVTVNRADNKDAMATYEELIHNIEKIANCYS